MEEEKQRISDFNDAAAQMQRLHNLWLKCESCKEQGNILKYENTLRSAESELKYDANKILERQDYISQIKAINVKIKMCNLLILKVGNSIFLGAAINKKWETLIEKEELLREVQQEAGKGGRYSDPYADEGM